jgi:hypothetical protein
MRRRESSAARFLRELALSRPERRAARAERKAEEAIRIERDNPYSAERRADRIEAERRRNNLLGGS